MNFQVPRNKFVPSPRSLGAALCETMWTAAAPAVAAAPPPTADSKRSQVSPQFALLASKVDAVLKDNGALSARITQALVDREPGASRRELTAVFSHYFSLVSQARSDARDGSLAAERLTRDVANFEGHLRDAQDRVLRVSEQQPVPLPEALLLESADAFAQASADALRRLDALAEAADDAKNIAEQTAQRLGSDRQSLAERVIHDLIKEVTELTEAASTDRKKPLEHALEGLRAKVCAIVNRDTGTHHVTPHFTGYSSAYSYSSAHGGGSRRVLGQSVGGRNPFDNERALFEDRARVQREAREARFWAQVRPVKDAKKKTTGSAAGAAGAGAAAAVGAASLFGAAAQNVAGVAPTAGGGAAAGGLFGGQPAAAAAGAPAVNFFGQQQAAPAAPAAPTVGGFFGAPLAPAAPAAGGLFGAAPAAPAAGGLFGAPAPTTGAPAVGLFGQQAAPPAPGAPAPAPALFGNLGGGGAPAPAAGGLGLFGQAPAPAAGGALVFGQPAGSGGLFGAAAPAGGGGLFGGVGLKTNPTQQKKSGNRR